MAVEAEFSSNTTSSLDLDPHIEVLRLKMGLAPHKTCFKKVFSYRVERQIRKGSSVVLCFQFCHPLQPFLVVKIDERT